MLANSINMTREKYNLDVWAYVLMPNHVHLLIYPNSFDYNVSLILKSIKQSTSQKIKSRVQNSGLKLPGLIENMISGKEFRFWQRGGGYDRNIYEMNLINPIIEYIHYNPVRKGWVDKPEDWKWSSAGFYIEGKKSVVIIDKENMNRRMI
ncbi:MAG: hypothetical protein GF307_08150 [candidate division Zixibacteria bacterium]|nr:hypothetical protein [candidate division Zixibacteria bacterium]